MKKIILLLIIFAGAISAIAQPAISGTSLIEFEENNASWKGSVSSLAAFLAAGGGTVASVTVTNANGLNGTVANSTSTPNITLSTTVTGMVKGTVLRSARQRPARITAPERRHSPRAS
jgi:hypothetical protein